MIAHPDRVQAVRNIEQAKKAGARLKKACEILGISSRTIQHWKKKDGTVHEDGRKNASRLEPGNKLMPEEEDKILKICNEKRFQGITPHQIVPILLDKGAYIASVSSFYRVLKRAGQTTRRGRSSPPVKKRPTSYAATAPNQVWSWDITYLKSPVRGQFFYLYLVMDIFSRQIVTWEVHDRESSGYASQMIRKACLKQRIQCGGPGNLDNGLSSDIAF